MSWIALFPTTDTLIDHKNSELPICLVISRDLNVRCSKWCNKDTTNLTDREIDTLTLSADYNQIINKPTHI